MEYVYCGGRFDFDYRQDRYEQKAAEDYRAVLLGNADKLLRNSGILWLSDRLSYVGPYYFETDGMLDREIVETEKGQIDSCTQTVFLLDVAPCPGTVAEMVYAASLGKKMRIVYIRDEGETESALRSPCWYPMILCQMFDPSRVELIPCATIAEARDQIVCFLRDLM